LSAPRPSVSFSATADVHEEQMSFPTDFLLLLLSMETLVSPQMHLLDGMNQPVLELERPFTCTHK